jgi:hypothetical protein
VCVRQADRAGAVRPASRRRRHRRPVGLRRGVDRPRCRQGPARPVPRSHRADARPPTTAGRAR